MSEVRSRKPRDASPGAKSKGKELAKKSKVSEKGEAKSALDLVEGFPPQLCALSLGCAGLSRAWALQGAWLLPRLWCLAAATYLCLYSLKALRLASVRRDASAAPALAALAAAPAAMQVLVLRLRQEQLVPLVVAQLVIILSHGLMLVAAGRFALLNWRTSARPDPSWFPGLLLSGMTNVSVSVAGPEWLRWLLVPGFFWLTIVLYVPVKLGVIYRLFLARERRSVTPTAAMATFMAPASFFTVVHLSIGKPGGDLAGYLLFADSTLSFWSTLVLLWVRRSLWATSFHPSYVSFTFPLASTATAALLVQEKLPALASPLLQAYGQILLYVATTVILSVQLRFVQLLVALRGKKK